MRPEREVEIRERLANIVKVYPLPWGYARSGSSFRDGWYEVAPLVDGEPEWNKELCATADDDEELAAFLGSAAACQTDLLTALDEAREQARKAEADLKLNASITVAGLRSLLRRFEWSDTNTSDHACCPVCRAPAWEQRGHRATCELDQALSAPAPRAEALGRLMTAVERWKAAGERLTTAQIQDSEEAHNLDGAFAAAEFELRAAWEEWKP
jgi:hypothetical protein